MIVKQEMEETTNLDLGKVTKQGVYPDVAFAKAAQTCKNKGFRKKTKDGQRLLKQIG